MKALIVFFALLIGCTETPVITEWVRDLSIVGAWTWEGNGWKYILVLEESGDYVKFGTDGEQAIVERGIWHTEGGRLFLAEPEEYLIEDGRLKIGTGWWWHRIEPPSEPPWEKD